MDPSPILQGFTQRDGKLPGCKQAHDGIGQRLSHHDLFLWVHALCELGDQVVHGGRPNLVKVGPELGDSSYVLFVVLRGAIVVPRVDEVEVGEYKPEELCVVIILAPLYEQVLIVKDLLISQLGIFILPFIWNELRILEESLCLVVPNRWHACPDVLLLEFKVCIRHWVQL